jgi:serine/threonine protein kinase
MSQRPKVLEDRQFIETCLALNLFHDTDADSLSAAIGDESGTIAQTALQRGLLTPADVDIVLSLQNPTTVAPGYKILELVGRGGMGAVYRAEQLDLERTVALKTILISNVNDPTVAARFEREAKALARLQHPNIVQALNFGKHEGRYYFAMEYVPGRTCEQAVSDGGFMPAEQVWSIVRQTASGLLHALRQNLIHRDIKPANLILLPPPEGSPSESEIVKIADFGLAMFADQDPEHLKLTTGDKVMGSPAYMSLEQFTGRQLDLRSDMYSLGATAWHLLFGAPPFQGANIAALFRQKSQPLVVDQSALPVVLPADQMQLLMGLLDPDPNQRPQDYKQLIAAIDALGVCDSHSPVPTDQTSWPDAAGRVSISGQPTLDSPLPITDDGHSPTQASKQIGESMSQTIELSESSLVPLASRFRWQIVAAILGGLVVVIGLV